MNNYEYKDLCSCIANCSRYGLDAMERGNDVDIHRLEYGPDILGGCKFTDVEYTIDTESVRPLLRPMSDITEKEMDHIKEITGVRETFSFSSNYYSLPLQIARIVLEYLDSRFLDYRGLIGLGNALPVGHRHYFQD